MQQITQTSAHWERGNYSVRWYDGSSEGNITVNVESNRIALAACDICNSFTSTSSGGAVELSTEQSKAANERTVCWLNRKRVTRYKHIHIFCA